MAFRQLCRLLIPPIILVLLITAQAPVTALAEGIGTHGRDLSVTGVYVKGKFTYRIIQQPEGDPAYVSPSRGALTQFGLAASYGVTGLLGHNYLAGSRFHDLVPGDRVYLFHDARRIDIYIVTEIQKFQALEPNSPYSDFKDLITGRMLTANEVFQRVYTDGPQVTFQTCIERNGNLSWGRLFVIAELLVQP